MNEVPNTAKIEALLVIRDAQGKILSVVERPDNSFKIYTTEFSTMDGLENLFVGIMKTSVNTD